MLGEISILLLGEISLMVDGEVRRLSGQRQRALLAYLSLRAPHHVGLDQLIDAIWGERPPKTARNSIQRFVSDIRRAMGPFSERLETTPDGYRLTATPAEVDAVRAQTLIEEGQAAMSAGKPTVAITQFRQALDLWRGRALGGLGDADFAFGEIARLEELHMSTVEDVIEAELALGRHREIAGTIESFAYEHRTRERGWSLLMLARYRCGRQAEAVAAYHELRAHLAEELDLEPSPSVEELHLQIIEQVPEVDSPAVSQSEAGLAPWSLEAPFAIPLPRPLERSSSFPMSGRSDEFATIVAARDAAFEDGPRVVLVGGEAGIGKTRLVSEVAARFQGEGASVFYGRCEEDLAAPYQPWVDMLEHFMRHASARVVDRVRERFGAPLSLLIPNTESEESSDGTNAARLRARLEFEDGHRQAMLFRAVTGLLEEADELSAMVLIFDDLQWADPSSLKLLRYVALRSRMPLLVVAAYRDTDVGDAHPLTDLVGVLQRGEKVDLITLGGLSDQATSELVDSAVGAEHEGQNLRVAAAIRKETNGNPFFITEFIPSLIENRALAADDADEFVLVHLPGSIQRVLRQRIGRLSDSEARVLRTASVFGSEFELGLVAATMELRELDVLDHVETSIRAGLVTDAPTGRDRFAFTHDIIHHYLYREMSPSRRGRMHARIADVIERKAADGPEERVEQLASHLIAAADPKQRERTVDACRQAGERAAAADAPTEAVLWFERALAQLAECTDPDEARRAVLLVKLGTQERYAGAASHWSTLTEAGRLAIETGDVDTLVESVLANSRSLNARTWEVDEDRIELLRAALDALGPVETIERANLLASLANEQWDAAHRSQAESLYRDSIALARKLADPTTLAIALIRVSRARNLRLSRDELHAISAEIREFISKEEIADPLVRAYGMTTILNTSLQLCLAGEAAEAMQTVLEAERDSTLPLNSNAAYAARSLAAGLRGDVAEYERLAGEMFESVADTGVDSEERTNIFEGQMFYSRYLQGRTSEIIEAIENIVRERPDVALYRAVSAIMHSEAQKFHEVSAMLDREVARGFEPAIDMFSIQTLTLWAEAAASAKHVEACRLLCDALMPFSTEMAGHLIQVTEPIALAMGRMCTCLGLFEDATTHFDMASQIADDFEGKWMRARTDLNRAQFFVARDAGGDRVAATDFAERAREVAIAQGYAAVQRDAELVLMESR